MLHRTGYGPLGLQLMPAGEEAVQHSIENQYGVISATISNGPPDEGLRDQTTIEAFWRYRFSQGLAITPRVQLLLDRALNPNEDKVWVRGLRFRLFSRF